jgi:hypothetical protein
MTPAAPAPPNGSPAASGSSRRGADRMLPLRVPDMIAELTARLAGEHP